MSLSPADRGAQQPHDAAPPLFAAVAAEKPHTSKHSHDHPAVQRQLTRGEATISDRSMGPPCVSTTTSGLVVVLAMRCSGVERDWSERHLEALTALQGLVSGCKAQMQLRSAGSEAICPTQRCPPDACCCPQHLLTCHSFS